ncbi:MAG: hypothetical protein CMJ46_03480 [Planctomyces sp.]|nr:hypothetical protein [Planctomyces sp.]
MRDPAAVGQTKRCPKCRAPFVVEPMSEEDDFGFGEADEDSGMVSAPRRRSARQGGNRRSGAEKSSVNKAGGKKGNAKAKRKKSGSGESNLATYIMIAAIPIVLVGLGAVIYFNMPDGALVGAEFTQPQEYVTWNTPTSAFEFDYPKDWDINSSKFKALVKYRSVEISAEHDTDDSMFNLDISSGPVLEGENPGDGHYPVDDVHTIKGKQMEEAYQSKSYSERDVGRVPTLLRNSHYAEYSYTSFFGTERRGYRLTILFSKFCQLNILMESDADEFEKAKPVFLKVMETFRDRNAEEDDDAMEDLPLEEEDGEFVEEEEER